MASLYKKLPASIIVMVILLGSVAQADSVITQFKISSSNYTFWASGTTSTSIYLYTYTKTATFYTSRDGVIWEETQVTVTPDPANFACQLRFTGGINGQGWVRGRSSTIESYSGYLYGNNLLTASPGNYPNPIYVDDSEHDLARITIYLEFAPVGNISVSGDKVVSIVPEHNYDGQMDIVTEVQEVEEEQPLEEGDDTEINNKFLIDIAPLVGIVGGVTRVEGKTNWGKTLNLKRDYWNDERIITDTATRQKFYNAKQLLGTYLTMTVTFAAFIMIWQEFRK